MTFREVELMIQTDKSRPLPFIFTDWLSRHVRPET